MVTYQRLMAPALFEAWALFDVGGFDPTIASVEDKDLLMLAKDFWRAVRHAHLTRGFVPAGDIAE